MDPQKPERCVLILSVVALFMYTCDNTPGRPKKQVAWWETRPDTGYRELRLQFSSPPRLMVCLICPSVPVLHIRREKRQSHRRPFHQPPVVERQQGDQGPAGRLHLHHQRYPWRQRNLLVQVHPHAQLLQLRVRDQREQDVRPERGAET